MVKRIWTMVAVASLLLPLPSAAGAPPVARYECFGKIARLTKPGRQGVVRGTRRNDVIIVLRRDVVVLAGPGNDRVCTGGGDDFVSGDAGHDRIRSGRGGDRLTGGEGLDYLNGEAGKDRLEGGHQHSDTLVGGYGADDLRGGDDESGGDYIFGGQGADLLRGGEGTSDHDFLVGGDGTDEIDGGGGSDTVSFAFSDVPLQVDLSAGTSSIDVLADIENVVGSVFDDLIVGDEQANRLEGDDGDDLVTAGAGSDHVDGGVGQDSLDGGEDTDVLSFWMSPRAVAADLATGSAVGRGNDTFGAFEHLSGSAYDDELSGDAGPNEIFGSHGADALFGREGDDTLYSASSGDAGTGTDLCWDSSGVIENCEQELHGDPSAYSTITSPRQATSLRIAQLKEVTGTASGGAFGPEPERVQVALRRLSGAGCYWWDAKHAAMQPGHCERPLWVRTDFDDGQGTWSRRIPSPVQLLNAGRYQLRSRIRQPGYTETVPGWSLNLVEFRLHQ